MLIAVGVDQDGYRHILGLCEGTKEDKASWSSFLRHLKQRGLSGVQLITSDKCLGLVESLGEFFPDAGWQRCTVHFMRNVMTAVPRSKMKAVAAMLKAIYAQEDRVEAERKTKFVADKLLAMKLPRAAELLRNSATETFSYYAFPPEHWRRLRTNNMLERIIREIRRRTRVVGCFPDSHSVLMLVGARLRHIASSKWGLQCYLNMRRLTELNQEQTQAAS